MQQICKSFLPVVSSHFRYQPLLPELACIADNNVKRYLLNLFAVTDP